MFEVDLMRAVRQRFHHVDRCPYQGERIFFENAGGSLTLKSVVETNAHFAAIPDNQGRDNPASQKLMEVIEKAREDMHLFFGTSHGQVFIGESGTELLFRLLRAAILGSVEGGTVVGSTLEHPASVSACQRWAKIAGKTYRAASHNSDTATVTAEDYQSLIDADTRVATIIHTSPVTGMSVDVPAVVASIRSKSPACLIIVDGIQHAPHAGLNIDDYDIDAYTVSAYKVYSRHNYGFAWISPRLSRLAHDHLDGTPEDFWELGTRDTSAFACTTEVVNYLDWLGAHFTASTDRRSRLIEAGQAIKKQERSLVETMIHGAGDQKGLAEMPEVFLIGGHHSQCREGLVSIIVEGIPCTEVVRQLNQRGVRTHVRKNDYFSGNILTPLNRPSCIRVSMCHYNTRDEVLQFLRALTAIIYR